MVTPEAIEYNKRNVLWWYQPKVLSAEKLVEAVDWFSFTSWVMGFQAKNGLKVDGKLGPRTLAAVQRAASGSGELILSPTSEKKLLECDERLQRVFRRVSAVAPITIVCGHRGEEAQEDAVRRGASKVHFPNSRHNTIPSMAVDVAPRGFEDGREIGPYITLSKHVWESAKEEGVVLEWGGNWEMGDYYHWQLKK